MDRESLTQLLDEGVSVERIARRFGKHPSTVSSWMDKYGLLAPNREKHAAKGAIAREQLVDLLDAGASISTMAEALQRSPTTVRHWLGKYGLETQRTARLREGRAAKEAGVAVIALVCRHHGKTEFVVEGRGTYRCLLCRSGAVLTRRRARTVTPRSRAERRIFWMRVPVKYSRSLPITRIRSSALPIRGSYLANGEVPVDEALAALAP